MSTSKLNFRAGNPGAVQYGNFINYYQFHPPEDRIKLLPTHLWPAREFCGLDLGCNAGNLTLNLYDFLRTKTAHCDLLGIDIDPTLIDRAAEQSSSYPNIQFHCADFMEETGRDYIRNYLKEKGLNKFNTVFCFSITMWIHLNYGDEGLKTFLRQVCALGDLILIEPQPWKCYRSAVKRMKLSNETFPLFETLKMREFVERDIQQFLMNDCSCVKIFESPRTEWNRKLLIYKPR